MVTCVGIYRAQNAYSRDIFLVQMISWLGTIYLLVSRACRYAVFFTNNTLRLGLRRQIVRRTDQSLRKQLKKLHSRGRIGVHGFRSTHVRPSSQLRLVHIYIRAHDQHQVREGKAYGRSHSISSQEHWAATVQS